MRYWAQIRSLLWVIVLGGILVFVGLTFASHSPKSEEVTTLQTSEREVQNFPPDIASISTHSPFVATAELVKPAVVNISAESMTEERLQPFGTY